MNVDWSRVLPYALIQVAIICAAAFFMNSCGADSFRPGQFTSLFFDTPFAQMKNVDGKGVKVHHPEYLDPLYDYWLCFDCESPPALKNAKQYAKGGDQIELTDFFLKRFPDRALSLMHSPDVDCLRRVDSHCEARWLFHNRKTKTYFFRCQYVRHGGDI